MKKLIVGTLKKLIVVTLKRLIHFVVGTRKKK